MTVALRKIAPLHAPLVPPEGAVPAGMTAEGDGPRRQLFTLKRMRSRAKPKLDAEGNREWVRNANGDRVIPKNEAEIYEETLTFYLESDGANNVTMVPYTPPTEAELAERAKRAKIEQYGGGDLGRALVEAGITPAELMERLKSPAPAAETEATLPEPEAPEPNVPAGDALAAFPIHEGGPQWTLSNGERFRGKKVEAEEAEAKVQEARSVVQTTPDF